MRITITTEIGEFHPLEVDSQMELENFKALIEAETETLVDNQILLYDGVELTDPKKTLEQYKVKQDDMLLLKKRNTGTQATASIIQLEAESIRQSILNDPQTVQQLRETIPELADAALNDRERFAILYQQMKQRRLEDERQRMQQIDFLNANPLEIETQRMIEEMIRMEKVKDDYETTVEHHPEFLGQITMLYINVKVNGHPVKAFVDSGAQGTIMSRSCAERCDVMKHLDIRFSGVARGVGTAEILGRVHIVHICVGKSFLPCSLTIIEEYGVDLLFGLDMLKRHQAIIDLEQNALIINNINKEVIPFLPEHELPERAQIDPRDTNSSQRRHPFFDINSFQRRQINSSQRGEPLLNSSSSTTTTSTSTTATSSSSISTPNSILPPSQLSNTNASIPASSASSQSQTYPEEHVKKIMSMGAITRDKAIELLNAAGGNLEIALNLLFG